MAQGAGMFHASDEEIEKDFGIFSEISEGQNCVTETDNAFVPKRVLEVAESWLDVKSPGSVAGMTQHPPGEPITKDQMARWTPMGSPAWVARDPEDQMAPPNTWHCLCLQNVTQPQGRRGGEKPN